MTTQRVMEHTTTVHPPKPEEVHVTTQQVMEHTTTVHPPKPEKVHVTTQRVIERTTTVKPAETCKGPRDDAAGRGAHDDRYAPEA